MAIRRVVRFFKNFENEYGPWFTFLVIASPRPDTDHGVSTIVPICETVPHGRVQTNHIATDGGALAALQKAIQHLDSIYGERGEGYSKIEDEF